MTAPFRENKERSVTCGGLTSDPIASFCGSRPRLLLTVAGGAGSLDPRRLECGVPVPTGAPRCLGMDAEHRDAAGRPEQSN
jgi:hypothetical protein